MLSQRKAPMARTNWILTERMTGLLKTFQPGLVHLLLQHLLPLRLLPQRPPLLEMRPNDWH